jgi:hypothetical protein
MAYVAGHAQVKKNFRRPLVRIPHGGASSINRQVGADYISKI